MGSTWVWVLLYILGFCLLQVLLYRYLQRSETSLDGATPDYGDGDTDLSAGHAAATPPENAGDDRVRCPNCGTPNDRTFSYCRMCTNRLDGAR